MSKKDVNFMGVEKHHPNTKRNLIIVGVGIFVLLVLGYFLFIGSLV
ncbi:MAG: hypothetical protein IJ308_09045 [Clostridia bacterium]|nr:hypothetical protein [Clostridia bacterium]